ncbi:SMP-30/gluconolactonase/LRE family protein [Brevibacillus fulvus]|uniref:Sugar lactone lactonase YvrE n=1 Tax=Brevibacillus fulvus TaxID=1125967 RepID=A0A938XYR3_9BACL|nr:SMP-30/gluconolactonase/LRE family protein [Brevibacillus fulvus]MBM7588891.1 sugar lactone lactonase YvrE [Brevibacillus fulvus]
MKKWFGLGLAILSLSAMASSVMAADGTKNMAVSQTKAQVSILTDLDPYFSTGMRIEGIIGDNQGRLYVADMDSHRLFRVSTETGKAEALTLLPRSTTGMAFDQQGNLYLASAGNPGEEGVVYRISAIDLKGSWIIPNDVKVFARGVNGANGLVFDQKGNLYVSGAATGNIYVVKPDGKVTAWATGLKPERTSQPITVNGLAFGPDHRLYISNTSSGEINRVTIKADGSFGQLERFVKSPLLYGADGITFAANGDLYVAVNERNAIVKVTSKARVSDVAVNDNRGKLEFPASLHRNGNTLYISNYDQPRGVNKDNKPGIGASIAEISIGQ